MVAHHSVKVASAWRPLSESKGKAKQGSINLAATSQSGKGKCKAISPLGHANGKKQHSHTTGAHIPPKISTLFSTFSKNACHWVVMHGTQQGMSSIYGLKRMAVPLELQNLLS